MMVKRQTLARKGPAASSTKCKKPDCIKCIHHYGLHEIGANGKPFLCKCKIHKERSRFLTKDGCREYTS